MGLQLEDEAGDEEQNGRQEGTRRAEGATAGAPSICLVSACIELLGLGIQVGPEVEEPASAK